MKIQLDDSNLSLWKKCFTVTLYDLAKYPSCQIVPHSSLGIKKYHGMGYFSSAHTSIRKSFLIGNSK